MLKLPEVTLVCITNKDFESHKKALDKSSEGIEWGARKIIWDEGITGISNWNEKVIQDLYKYVDTTHMLLYHQDGYVINPELWDDSWLELDYIGSPWPLPTDSYSYRTPSGKLIRVGNSVSLRSKKLMELVSTRPIELHYGNNNEDGQICVWERDWLESQGCKFATFEQALKFGKEAPLPENIGLKTFVFHEFN